MIFKTLNLNSNNIYDIADNKTKNIVNTYIEEWKDKKLLTGYFGILSKNIYNRTRVKNSEILELLIYGSYIEEQSKLHKYEKQIMYEDINYYYKQGQKEVLNAQNKVKPISIIDMALFLYLLEQANLEQYIQMTIQYNAQQIYKQALINIQQQKELEIENDEFQRIINQQQNTKLCINNDKISGFMDNQLIGLNNLAKVEGIRQLDNEAKVKFIAITDENETDMCHSLDGQIFYIDKDNEFDRYYGETQKDLKIQRIKCKGLVIGLNLPPISHHFHWCRSTVTYQYDKEHKIDLAQEYYNGKKEKMNWQEKNEDFKSNIIKPELYKNISRKYRIKKYENYIIKLYSKNNNENMCILDKITGKLIGNITEGKNRTTVGLDTPTMLKMITHSKNSIIAIHNHPENYTFSLTDILSFNRLKQIDTMIVLTDNYKYYLKSNTTKKYTNEHIQQLYKEIEKNTNKVYNHLNGVEKRDLTNQEFFKKVGWIYEKEKN